MVDIIFATRLQPNGMVLTSHYYIRKSMNVKDATSFDIRVALLGHVSVGKTTLLNALLKDKYGEVSMRRTTAGINHFRVNRTSIAPPAEQVLDEITEDNTVLREETTIREKFFDVVLEEQLLNMREDTSLVIVDIPGLNEAGSRDMYLKYVKDSWDTFDCAIVVMDVSLGVNSEEQVNLLRFVKENIEEQKQIPVIVLCNKVDDPDDAEVIELVKEVEQKVAKMFPGYAANSKTQNEKTAGTGVAFVPISAGNAYMYRSASRLPLQDFKRLDKGCINKIGREECGKFKWKRLSREKQYELVYEVVKDPAQLEERLEACKFDTFLSTLETFLGGKGAQEELIAKQIDTMLSKISHEKGFAKKLGSIYDRSTVLGRDVNGLCTTFWKLYRKSKKVAFNEFKNDPTQVTYLGKLMDELTNYSRGLHAKLFAIEGMATARKRDASKIVEAMKIMIKDLCGVLVQKETAWHFDCYFNYVLNCSHNPVPTLSSWAQLSPYDWHSILSSILLMKHRQHFCQHFGAEIAQLEWLNKTGKFNMNKVNFTVCVDCGRYKYQCGCMAPRIGMYETALSGKYKNGAFVPNDEDTYKRAVQINLRSSPPQDAEHWGHLIWQFCEYMDSHAEDGDDDDEDAAGGQAEDEELERGDDEDDDDEDDDAEDGYNDDDADGNGDNSSSKYEVVEDAYYDEGGDY